MQKIFTTTIALLFLVVLCACTHEADNSGQGEADAGLEESVVVREQHEDVQRVDFTQRNDAFLFTGDFPDAWAVEYIAQTEAINIYDPTADVDDSIDQDQHTVEQSQIFIRTFEANDFLTLTTVDIGERIPQIVHGREAVAYDITKKADVAQFTHQPTWRSGWHQVLDIRYSTDTPSLFYVFAHNPTLDETIFRAFIDSLVFGEDRHKTSVAAREATEQKEDAQKIVPPLERAYERITKKPFGMLIDPETSPVQPERFSGYHSGTDFEIFDDERDDDSDVIVHALCEGEILSARRIAGYGGVITQSCSINDEAVRVLYGHVSMGNSRVRVGDRVDAGDEITLLGDHRSADTDGERKHLHLGITRGAQTDVRGYVKNNSELTKWYDFQSL